jgi:hypothetical protein
LVTGRLDTTVIVELGENQVLMTASMKMAVFWDVEPCSVVEFYYYLKALTAFFIRAIAF